MIHRIHVGWEESAPIALHCQDEGSGPPVVLVHGWPLASGCWAAQCDALVALGHRVIRYDRRGCGQSSRTQQACDADTRADDLHRLIECLDLQQVCLIGYSTGVGDVTRLLGTYGAERIARTMLISGAPAGDAAAVQWVAAMAGAMAQNRAHCVHDFLARSHQCDDAGARGLSAQALQAQCALALASLPAGAQEALAHWSHDFSDDLPRIDLPCLVLHGGSDRILPCARSSRLLHEGIAGSELVVLEGASHALLHTHAEHVNREIARFLGGTTGGA